jgi:hypothetical protein
MPPITPASDSAGVIGLRRLPVPNAAGTPMTASCEGLGPAAPSSMRLSARMARASGPSLRFRAPPSTWPDLRFRAPPSTRPDLRFRAPPPAPPDLRFRAPLSTPPDLRFLASLSTPPAPRIVRSSSSALPLCPRTSRAAPCTNGPRRDRGFGLPSPTSRRLARGLSFPDRRSLSFSASLSPTQLPPNSR